MKKKLLLTGASGFLGYHLLRLATDWEVYGIYHANQFHFNRATSLKCDIANYIELGNYFEDIEPDAVIHTAAIADANFCQENKELSDLINVDAARNMAGICSDYRIPFAFTSTDLVFDGKKGMYREEDTRNPVSVYGEQKAKAEDEILKIYPDATVFRLPMMFGYADAGTANYLQKFIGQMRKGETVNLFTDEYRSVCGAKSISKGILQLLERTSGIIHLAGGERLSRYDFGTMVIKAFAIKTGKINGCSQKEVKLSAPRPADVSLDISKAVKLGYVPMRAADELDQVAHFNALIP